MRVVALGMVLALALCAGSGCSSPSAATSATLDSGGMKAFPSEAELSQFARTMQKRSPEVFRESGYAYEAAPPVALNAPPNLADTALEEPAERGQITNVQEAGVDEGGIVKTAGDYLVVLRRGRIFTIRHGHGALEPVDTIDAFPPGAANPAATWYDELLVAGDQLVVIGYSYGSAGTEVNRFRLSRDGKLTYRDTHYLRSGDYYSSSNYASRLIGDELIVYAPVYVDWAHWRDALPAINGRSASGAVAEAKPLVDARSMFVAEPYRRGDYELGVMHTVTRCDLASDDLDCSATAVAGGWSRSFYVARDAVYVWTEAPAPFADRTRKPVGGMLYRLPFDGSVPGAVQVSGGPIDQFSFLEQRDAGLLHVLLRGEGRGDAMWASEGTEGSLALLDLPLGVFGDGAGAAARAAYRPLPGADGWSVRNRYVGQHLLYALADYGQEEQTPQLYAVPLAGGEAITVDLPHGVTRLDALGSDGVAIGPGRGGALGFSAIKLDARSGAASLEDTSFLPGASEGETRSQALFFRPDPGLADGTSGTLGLPISRRLERDGREFLGSGSAVAFVRRDRRHLAPAGELVADDEHTRPDGCRASCVDWYGNARPIFLGDRVFALMGYELVEGRLAGGRIAELRRVDFAPRAASIAARTD